VIFAGSFVAAVAEVVVEIAKPRIADATMARLRTEFIVESFK
jgi:hypothetical protein